MNTKTKVLPGAPQVSASGQADTGTAAGTSEPARPSAADVIGADKFAGKGGSFTFDPGSGLRAPTAETEEHLRKHEPKHEKKESK